jgi:hypothetical protein
MLCTIHFLRHTAVPTLITFDVFQYQYNITPIFIHSGVALMIMINYKFDLFLAQFLFEQCPMDSQILASSQFFICGMTSSCFFPVPVPHALPDYNFFSHILPPSIILRFWAVFILFLILDVSVLTCLCIFLIDVFFLFLNYFENKPNIRQKAFI